jgi:hypothetical protein
VTFFEELLNPIAKEQEKEKKNEKGREKKQE